MPRDLLTHRLSLAHRLDGSSDLYRLTSFDVPEVTTGKVTTEVRCGACDQPVSCVVESRRARAWRRRGVWLIFFGVLVLASLAAMAIALLVEPTDVDGAFRVGFVVAVTGGIVGSAFASAAVEIVRESDRYGGVRLRRRHPPHSVCHAKDLIEGDQGTWSRRYVAASYSHDCNADALTCW